MWLVIRTDPDSYRILGQKYGLPSHKCGRSVNERWASWRTGECVGERAGEWASESWRTEDFNLIQLRASRKSQHSPAVTSDLSRCSGKRGWRSQCPFLLRRSCCGSSPSLVRSTKKTRHNCHRRAALLSSKLLSGTSWARSLHRVSRQTCHVWRHQTTVVDVRCLL